MVRAIAKMGIWHIIWYKTYDVLKKKKKKKQLSSAVNLKSNFYLTLTLT